MTSFTKFEDSIHDFCRATCAGFGYAIFKEKELWRKDGYGKAEIDAGVDFDGDTRFEIASCAKTITAAAAIRALILNPDLTLNSKISEALPKGWTIHSVFEDVTIEDVLMHKSGLVTPSKSWEKLGLMPLVQTVLAAGISEDRENAGYQNVNYALLRIMMPFLARKLPRATLDGMTPVLYDFFSSSSYMAFVREHILDPCDVPSDVSVSRSGPKPYALGYYASPPLLWATMSAEQPNVGPQCAGPFGWKMSAAELASVIVGLQHEPTLRRTWERMKRDKEKLLGVRQGFTSAGPGSKYWHNHGSWSVDGAGGRAAWLTCDSLTAALFINCQGAIMLEEDGEFPFNTSELAPHEVLQQSLTKALS